MKSEGLNRCPRLHWFCVKASTAHSIHILRMHYKSAFKGELDVKCWGYRLAIVFTNDAASQTYSFTHSKTCIWCHVVPGTVQISKARYRHK